MKSILVLCALLTLGGCASSEHVHDEQLPLEHRLAKLGLSQGELQTSISRYEIDDWEYLDKRHILLGLAPGRRYLLEFTRDCDRLDFSSTIGYSSTIGQLTHLDHVTVFDGMGEMPQICQIDKLYRLERVEKPAP
ncbi:hypothetical protein IB229_04965 [Pseudomonas sp. PDM14]|uniref:DUF6491 family protein n=1 Tax=Pseudomonas sp. PDM14 TaxID=2769288 RepID=UPI00177B9263|nr:DUF6491 family protein [Pseudomonas sp. PDM14]MBD9482311.1 hypothetical protein [Pseudomonas sp. PDM14]